MVNLWTKHGEYTSSKKNHIDFKCRDGNTYMAPPAPGPTALKNETALTDNPFALPRCLGV